MTLEAQNILLRRTLETYAVQLITLPMQVIGPAWQPTKVCTICCAKAPHGQPLKHKETCILKSNTP